MPNSKFFIGSYAGDVTTHSEKYAACEWSSTVRKACQPVQASIECEHLTPNNPYSYAKMLPAKSARYTTLPVNSIGEEKPVEIACTTYPAYPTRSCSPEPECPPEPEQSAEENPCAVLRPRRRNCLNMQENMAEYIFPPSLARTCAQVNPDLTIRPMPKRKCCGCNYLPVETPKDTSEQPTDQLNSVGRYIDVPDEEVCPPKKREKCFLYEKLKQYYRKGETLGEFLNDYDEETFYAFIE